MSIAKKTIAVAACVGVAGALAALPAAAQANVWVDSVHVVNNTSSTLTTNPSATAPSWWTLSDASFATAPDSSIAPGASNTFNFVSTSAIEGMTVTGEYGGLDNNFVLTLKDPYPLGSPSATCQPAAGTSSHTCGTSVNTQPGNTDHTDYTVIFQ